MSSGGQQPDPTAHPTADTRPDIVSDSAPDLAPDPDAYDAPRAVQARARGLAAPYIAGGEDPDIDRTRRDERRYLRLLLAMIVVLVLSGFVLGVVQKLLEQAT